jgi:LPXTG-site transpeptidase (sortase) family protein
MSEESKKNSISRSGNQNTLLQYVLTSAVFVAIAMAVVIPVIIIGFAPAKALVHRIDNAYPISAADIVIDNEQADFESGDFRYGSFVADVECTARGLDCRVYYGADRVSSRYGAGLLNRKAFGENGNKVITGYDETYFSSVKYIEKGDIIKVRTKSACYAYKVKDTFVDVVDSPVLQEEKGNTLFLYSICSDLSSNSGKCYYVSAEYTGEEGSV